MDKDVEIQLEGLNGAIGEHQIRAGKDLVDAVIPVMNDLAVWIVYFRTITTSGTALELLNGAQAAALESIAYICVGLGRAALTAIRLQIELLTGYTYFKDHPVEWERVRRTGDGFVMFAFLETYHRELDRKLGARLEMVEQRASPTLKQIYRLLSAHVDGQSPYTLPQPGPLQSLVLGREFMESIVDVQKQTVRALTFFLVAIYAREWPQLPTEFVTDVSRALTAKQRRLFFSAD